MSTSVLLRLLSWLLLVCVAMQPVAAKKVYSYQDENGSWHFSDSKPDTDTGVDVIVKRIKIHQLDKKVYVRRVGARSTPSIQVQNLFAGPIEIEFQLKDAVNTVAKPSLPRSFVIPAESTVNVFSLLPINSRQSWSTAFVYKFVPGSPEAVHAQVDSYNPPYSHGAGFRVTQGFNGDYSHNGPQGRYAVDFAMPDGSLVHAAREGVVMDVASDFYNGGSSSSSYRYK